VRVTVYGACSTSFEVDREEWHALSNDEKFDRCREEFRGSVSVHEASAWDAEDGTEGP